MSSTLETVSYSYDDETHSLEADEALEVYRREKALHPDALVVLELLHCDRHWDVDVYTSDAEKEEYLKTRIKKLFDRFVSGLKK